jgi:transcription elongation factor S-II
MDRREIQAKGSLLQKAIQNKEPTSDILAILQDLKKGVKPTEELLRATAIGKVVNKAKGLPGLDPKISQMASEIISKWRHVIAEQKTASGTSTPTNNRPNGSSAPSSKPSTPAPAAMVSVSSPPGVDLSKRSWQSDKIVLEDLTTDESRNRCIGLLYDGLAKTTSFPAKNVLAKARDIEKACLYLPGADGNTKSSVYKVKIRSLYQNLMNKNNPELRTSVLNSKYTPEQFVNLTAEQLKSEHQQAEDAKLAKDNMANAMVAQEERSVSTSLECGKCHEKKVSYTQAQTRSADVSPHFSFTTIDNCTDRCRNR